MTAAATWQTLLTRSTLQIDADGPGGPSYGTGFVVAPGVIATCAHVLAAPGAPLPSRVSGRVVATGREVTLEVDPATYFRDPVTGLDLALLRVPETDRSELRPVLLSADLLPGDELHAFGHPVGAFRSGQHATLTFQGDSRRDVTGGIALPRGYGVPVGPGFSGSPVFSHRTGAVCGMLTTSDSSGSAHLVSAADVLARCAEADMLRTSVSVHRAWLESLGDDQLTAGGWRFPGRWLRDYLAAAVAEASEQPDDAPDLHSVYVQQNLEAYGTPAEPITTAYTLRGEAAYDAVARITGDVLLWGDPGIGKSTMLRFIAVDAAQRWLESDDVQGVDVPVRVHAGALAEPGSLVERLAAAVAADLGPYLPGPLPAGVFQRPPLAGARWLVLVDGLDEITDRDRRSTVLNLLGRHTGDRFRFVLTSRPVPDRELKTLPWSDTVSIFEVLPLTRGQLSHVARRWLTRMPNPDTAVHRLLTHAKRLGTDLSANPMMATMLCRLFLTDPERQLPSNRYHLYRDFIALLRGQQYASARDSVVRQVTATVKAFGAVAEAAVASLPARVNDNLPAIARAYLADGSVSVLNELLSCVVDLRPPDMPEPDWRELVRYCSLRNGQLISHGDDVTFLHRTLAEYFSVRHIIDAEPQQVSRQLRRILAAGRSTQRLASADLLFIAALGDDPRVTESLFRMLYDRQWSRRLLPAESSWRHDRVHSADLAAVSLVATLVRDGVELDYQVRSATRRRLKELEEAPRVTEAEHDAITTALASLGEPRGLDRLAAVAADPDADPRRRLRAARQANDFGDSRGSDQLAALATVTGLPYEERLSAAEDLALVDDQRGNDLLHLFATEPEEQMPTSIRLDAARALGTVEDPRYGAVLALLSTEPAVFASYRWLLLRELRRHGGRLYVRTLVALSTNHALDNYARLQVVAELAEVGGAAYADVLSAVAEDSTFRRGDRLSAAEALDAMGDPRGLVHLDALESYALGGDDGEDGYLILLGFTGDRYGLDRLAALAADQSTDLGYGVVAATVLAQMRDPRGLDLLASFAADAATDFGARIMTAVLLSQLGDGRGLVHLEELVAASEADAEDRLGAAAAIGIFDEQGGLRHRAALTSFAEDREVDADLRICVAAALARLGDASGVRLLDELAAAEELESDVRVRAAIALGKAGDPRGPDHLHTLAADRNLPDDTRVTAASALGRTEDPRRVPVLAAVMVEVAYGSSEELLLRVVNALRRLGHAGEALKDLVRAVAADETVDAQVRDWATELELDDSPDWI